MPDWSFFIPVFGAAIAAGHDVRSREMPDCIPTGLLLTAVAFVAAGWMPVSATSASVGCLVAGGITAGLWAMRGIGGGDVKLLAALGAWVGWPGVLGLLVFSAIGGMVCAFVALARKQSTFAYGPAILGGLVCQLLLPGLFQF